MTEKEMRNRMKEIDKERDRLKKEKEEYEQYFHEKRTKEQLENRKQFEGKCFVSKTSMDYSHQEMKAFKVLNVLDSPNEKYAECLVLAWGTTAIKKQVVGLWLPNELRLMNSENDPKVIDFYKEVSLEEFEKMYKEYQKEFDKCLK